MAFDLSTAKPVTNGFDLSTASPVESVSDRLKRENPAEYDPSSPQYQAKYGPTSDMSTTDKLRAGAGKAFVDLGRGVNQVAAGVEDLVAPRQQNLQGLIDGTKPVSRVDEQRANVAASRQLDAPLMKTTAAKVGNIAGNIVSTAPALAIPGANTVAGAALVGGALGALQPSTSTGETLVNTGLGAATSAAGQYAGQKLAQAIAGRRAASAVAADAEREANSLRDAVLKESRDAGYVVPPTAAKASALNTAVESIAGKAATRQDASFRNAKVTTGLVAEDLGLPSGKPITRDALQAVRDKAGQVYQDVRSLGQVASDYQYRTDIANLTQNVKDLEGAYPGIGSQANSAVAQLSKALEQDTHDASKLVDLSKFLRARARTNYKAAFGSGGDPEKLALAQAQTGAVNAIEDLLQRHMAASGNADLATAWDAARTTIAKSYQAEAALSGGNVSAAKLALQMQRGKPVSGGMGVAARFADMFPDVAKAPKSGAGVSKLGAAVGGTGAIASLLTGNPVAAAVLASSPVASFALRRGALTQAGQAALATPSYGPGMLARGASDASEKLANYFALPTTQAALAIRSK